MMKEKKQDIVFFIIVGVLVFLPIIALGDDIGLHYDAINSEYGGQMILSPDNSEAWYHYISFPFLSQIYRGVPNLWISLIDSLLTGTTSVIQHNIEVTLVFFTCLVSFYYLLEFFSVKKQIQVLVTIILAVSPSLLTVTLTRFHVGLLGVLFTIWSCILFMKWREGRKNKKLIFSAIFLGMAFYTYYCFLFFIPMYFILLLKEKIPWTERIRNGLIFISGFLSGCALYFVGYTEIFLRNIDLFKDDILKRVIASMVMAIFVWGITFLIYFLLKQERWKPVIAICITSILIGIIWLRLVFPQVRVIFANIPIRVEKLTLGGRFKLVFKYVENILTGRAGEQLIYNEVYARFLSMFKLLFIAMDVVYVCFIPKTKLLHDKVFGLSLVFLFYLFGNFVFVSRQGPQHYLPLLF